MDTRPFDPAVGETAALLPDDGLDTWSEPDRPGREDDRAEGRTLRTLLANGPAALTHAELLTVVLGARGPHGCRIARRLIRRHGLDGMARLGPRAWIVERGIGPASAARLAAVFELGRRIHQRDSEERPRISSPRDAWRQVRHIGRARKEHLVGLYVDAQNLLVHRETISVGSLNTTRTHPREVLHPAVVHLALGFVLAHNHPSGCLDPSSEDAEFTHSIRRAGELMGIELYDHLIVTRGGYTSLRERGLL